MQQNLDSGSVLSMASMAERGDQLNLIEKRTGNLVNAAETFQKGTKDLGQKEKFSNDKLWLVIVIWVPFAIVIALMLVLIIIAVAIAVK